MIFFYRQTHKMPILPISVLLSLQVTPQNNNYNSARNISAQTACPI